MKNLTAISAAIVFSFSVLTLPFKAQAQRSIADSTGVQVLTGVRTKTDEVKDALGFEITGVKTQIQNQGTKPWTAYFSGQSGSISASQIINMTWADGAFAYNRGRQNVTYTFQSDGTVAVISQDGRAISTNPAPFGSAPVYLRGLTCRQMNINPEDGGGVVNFAFALTPSGQASASGGPSSFTLVCPY